jgi:hypothetical protein
VQAAGCPGALVHDMRRSAVRTFERAGVPRSVAMSIVGQKTESIYRGYALVDEAMQREAAARLDAWTEASHPTRGRKRRTLPPRRLRSCGFKEHRTEQRLLGWARLQHQRLTVMVDRGSAILCDVAKKGRTRVTFQIGALPRRLTVGQIATKYSVSRPKSDALSTSVFDILLPESWSSWSKVRVYGKGSSSGSKFSKSEYARARAAEKMRPRTKKASPKKASDKTRNSKTRRKG